MTTPRAWRSARRAGVRGGFGFDVHLDGRQIAFVAGENKAEVWALENFLPAPSAKR